MSPVVTAIVKRDFKSYFSNPAGYVFITLFVFLGALAAFWQERFFADNLANLDTLSRVFPLLLLFFVPAITMSAWAEERRQGTDELLLTLPAKAWEVVLGKYLGSSLIYTVALLFSTTNILVLLYLGDPDPGLLFSTYVGYWLLGLALIGMGMVGSILARSVTVGFILGALACALVVFVDTLGGLIGGSVGELLTQFSSRSLFREFGAGVITLSGVAFFLGVAVLAIVANISILRVRREGRDGSGASLTLHTALRMGALAVAVVSLAAILDRLAVRPDLTAEGLHSLSPESARLIAEVEPDRPVFVQAFVSPEVPREYVETRSNLVNLLREFDQLGGSNVVVKIHDTERYTDVAREAQEKFGILPATVPSIEGGRSSTQDVFLGFAVTSGLNEVVVPFLHKGLPVEYELTRSIRVAARKNRLKVGVLKTDAKVFGGFDFATMNQSPPWAIVRELTKQYEVVEVDAAADYPTDLDVLLAAMPSSLTQPELDRFADYVMGGNATLVFDDPLPLANPALGPREPKPKPGGNNPFGGGPPPAQKGDFQGFLTDIGLVWQDTQVVWDAWNPHPTMQTLEPEVVFVGAKAHDDQPFHEEDATTSGLQEVAFLFAGRVSAAPGNTGFTPLIRTTQQSGTLAASEVLQRSFFGYGGLNPNRKHLVDGQTHVLAARLSNAIGPGGEAANLIFVADLDMVGEQFFQLREMGAEGLDLDNVTFVLNCVDVLAGDESFVALRKRRREHRTLTRVEKLTKAYQDESLASSKAAEEEAEEKLAAAQKALDAQVAQVRARTDLDENAKAIMVQTVTRNEQRKLDVAKAGIEAEKSRAIAAGRAEKEASIRDLQTGIKLWAVALPPIPAILIGLWMLWSRLVAEKRGFEGTARERKSS